MTTIYTPLRMKFFLPLCFLLLLSQSIKAQESLCINNALEHRISSKNLKEERAYWVSLPLQYSDSISYPVIYVLDAEWRFDLVRNMAFDLGGNHKIRKSIIVGIPHIDPEHKRGIDLTFSQSRMEYDGEKVDSTWYNASNSGGGQKFYDYFVKELIPDVNKRYSTNDHETLIGHSYGGYFGAYLLSMHHPFEVIHMYDPSIWYSNGEVIQRLRERIPLKKELKLYLTYQTTPQFHKDQIEQFISELKKVDHFDLMKVKYEDETHNSLYLESFLKGVQRTNRK